MAGKYKTFPRIVPLTRNDFVGQELLKRKNQSFGEGASPRTIWVRAISNAYQVDENGEKILGVVGNRNVLVGGLLSKSFYTRGSFETLYRRPGRQIQDKPIPGIDSISITSKGELQALRKVTINWSCPNLEDLDELSSYWLSPGLTVWLEWGWGRIGKTPITVPVDSPERLTQYYNDAEKIYDEIIIGSNGNQDAYIGIITNFSFNQNDDGSWSCVTELTSLGQTLIGMDLNKDKVYKGASLSDEAKKQVTENIKGFIEDKFSEGDLLTLSIPDDHPLREKGYKTWRDSKDVYHASKTFWGLDWLAKDVTYVSWRFIEQAIINQQIALYADGEGGKVKAFQINSEDVQISNDPLLFTTNAEGGLVVHDEGNGAFSFDVPDTNQFAGYVTNLYFDADTVEDTFLNAETFEEAAMKLLRGISNACADIWNFKLQPNPMNERDLQVIDLNFVSEDDLRGMDNAIKAEASSGDKVLSLGGYSGESILSNVSFTSKLTDQLALKYVVSRNKAKSQSQLVVQDDNDAGTQAMFGGFRDRIIDNLEPPPSPPETEEEKQKRLEKEREEKEKRKNVSVTLLELRNALKTGRRPKVANSDWPANIIILEDEGKEMLVEYINRDLTTDSTGKITENRVRHQPLYPLEISITLDGISGILPGNCFTLDNLPKMYKESGVFQVVEVGHEVSADDWTTNLRCFFRLTSRDNNPVVYYDPNEVNNEKEPEEPTEEGL